MAKNKEQKGQSLSLDEYDFGDEFNFEEFDLQPKPPSNKREATERVASSALEGVVDTVKSPSFFREMIRKALPRGYGNMLDIADQAATSVRDLYNDSAKEMKPALRDVARIIDKNANVVSALPKPAQRLLEKFAEANRANPAAQVGVGGEGALDMAVAGVLADTFKYNVQADAKRQATEEARQGIQAAIEKDRHEGSIAQLEGIRKSVVSMAAYQRRIEFRFQQKSLELQARQYFVMTDMLNEAKKQNLKNNELLQGIVKNTSLPDILKMKASEKFMDMLRNRAFSGLQDGIFGQRANFMQNMGKAFRDQALGSIKTFAGGIREGVSGIEMAQDSAQMAAEMGMDRYRALGNAAGSMGAQWLGGLGADRLNESIEGNRSNTRMGRVAKAVRRIGGKLQFGASNMPQIASDFSNRATTAEDYFDDAIGNRLPDGPRGFLRSLADVIGNPILDLTRGTIRRANAMDTEVKSTGVADAHKPMAYNNQAHRTLVEVIPGLLARMVQEQQIARTGDTSIDLIQYDFGKGKFSTTKAVRRGVFNKLFDQRSRDGVQNEKDRLMEMVDPSGVLNPVQKAELAKILMNDNLRGRAGYETGRVTNYLNASNFNGSENGEAFAKLFQELNKKRKAEGEYGIDNDFAERFSGVGRSMSGRHQEIQQLLEVYPRDLLDDMGLLTEDGRNVNMQKVYAYFGGENYQAKGIQGQGGFRALPAGNSTTYNIHNRALDLVRNNTTNAIPQLGAPQATPSAEPVANPLLDEIKRLILTIENQNTLPVTLEIKDILLATQQAIQNGDFGGSGPSRIDQMLEMAGSAGNAAQAAARRAKRLALVRAGRLRAQHQDRIDAVRNRAGELLGEAQTRGREWRDRGQALFDQGRDMGEQWWEENGDRLMSDFEGNRDELMDNLRNRRDQFIGDAGVAARRAKRQALVQGARLRRMMEGQKASLSERLQGYAQQGRDRWAQRPSLEQLRDMLSESLAQAKGQAGAAADMVRERAGQAARGARGMWQRGSEEVRERVESNQTDTLLGEIKEVLLGIQERLDDGIMTMGMPENGELPPGLLRRGAGAARRGLSRINMRISDMAKGVFRLTKGTAQLGGRVANTLVAGGIKTAWKLGKGAADLAGEAATFAVSSQYRRARGFIDIYVGSERKPRIYGRLLQEGNTYFDQETGKPISRMKDITGTVVKRTDGVDEVVLEADEIAMAYQRMGPIKKSLKAAGVIVKSAYGIGKKITGAITQGIPPVFRMAWGAAKKVWGLLDMAQDIFVKDRLDSPAMTARIMRAGGYRSAVTGDVIKRPSKIDGPVLSGDETVLTHDDIRKGLVDKDGKPIRTGLNKLANWAFGGIKTAAKWGLKAGKLVNRVATKMVKDGISLGKKLTKGAVKVGGGAFDLLRLRNPFKGGEQSIDEQTVQAVAESKSLLQEIRDILRDRLPERKKVKGDIDGDGIRDGSYEDLMKDKAAAEKAKAEKAAQVGGGDETKKPGFFASLLAKLRGRKDEEEEDDEEGGVNVDLGGGDGGGNDKETARDKKRRRRLARRPGGSWRTSQGWKGKSKFLLGKAGRGLAAAGRFGVGLLGSGLGVGSMLGGAGTALAGAGSAIAGGAAAVGGAIATGATALAGLISAPVVLGALAVAAVGAGAYYGYKYLTKKKLGLLSRVRYAQYGFPPSDEGDHLNAVFGLEDKLKDAIIYGKEGAKLDGKRVKPEDLVKDFDVDEDDKVAVKRWVGWFSNRFKPVFLTHVTALKAIAGSKWLSDVDDLDPPIALQYLTATKFPEGPYNVSTSPFKDLEQLKADGGDVQALIKIAETELQKKGNGKGAKQMAQVGAAAAVTATAAAPGAKAATPQVGGQPVGMSNKVLSQATAVAGMGVGGAAMGGSVTVIGSNNILNGIGVDRVDGLDVVRMKAYGLVKMELDKVRALTALERNVQQNLVYNKNVASWEGSLEHVLNGNGAAFGVDITNEALAANWLSWFNQRFLPVYLNYATLVKAQTGKDDPVMGKDVMKAQQLLDVATALATSSGSGGSVWNVSVSPWSDYELNADVRSTEGNIQAMKDMVKSAVLNEPGGKNSNQPTAAKSAANSNDAWNIPKLGGALGGLWNGLSAGASSIVSAGKSVANSVSTFFGGPPIGGGATGESSFGGGSEVKHPGQGTGGDINAIPKPTGNKSWAAVKDTILAAAKMVGVDGKLMATMAAIESGFDHTVKAGTSSATGLFQFIKSTWDTMVKKFGGKYGIAPGTPPTDARANALMGAEYIKWNMESLNGKIGRPVTDTDLYMAHFLGSGGAKKFLKQDPNAIAATIMPKEAAANRGIFYDKSGNPLTVGQVYQLMSKKLQTRAKAHGIDGSEALVSSAPVAQPPAPGTDLPPAGVAPAPKGTPAVSQFAVGAASTSAPTASTSKSAQPAPSAPVRSVPSIGELSAGFVPPQSKADQMSAAKQMHEVRVNNLKETNDLLEESVDLQGKMLTALQNIDKGIGALGTLAKQPAPAPAQQTSQGARATERRVAELPRPPVSVSRPPAPY